jgi:hypothetical protein
VSEIDAERATAIAAASLSDSTGQSILELVKIGVAQVLAATALEERRRDEEIARRKSEDSEQTAMEEARMTAELRRIRTEMNTIPVPVLIAKMGVPDDPTIQSAALRDEMMGAAMAALGMGRHAAAVETALVFVARHAPCYDEATAALSGSSDGSVPADGTIAALILKVAFEVVTSFDRRVTAAVLAHSERLTSTAKTQISKFYTQNEGDLVLKMLKIFDAQVPCPDRGALAAAAAVRMARMFNRHIDQRPGAVKVAVLQHNQERDQAEDLAKDAGLPTDLRMTYFEDCVRLLEAILGSGDGDARTMLDHMKFLAATQALDIFDSKAVGNNVDRIVEVAERMRAIAAKSGTGQPTGAAKAAVHAKAAEDKATVVRAKTEAAARAEAAAAAAAATAAATKTVRGNAAFSGFAGTCHGCGMVGHKKGDCPEAPCERCKKKGHAARACTAPAPVP